MIRKSVLDKIGLLDPVFGLGYGEDVDLSCRCEDAGFKVVQVPQSNKLHYDGRLAYGNFPIWHDGNKTFQLLNGAQGLIDRNHDILVNRYNGAILGNAVKLGEWLTEQELMWLGRQAKKSKIVIEVGSWFGKSSTVIADNLPKDGVLYCIDTWKGSKAEQDTNHRQAREMDGDFAFYEFSRNLWRHIESGKLRPIRMHGVHAAKLLKDQKIKADLVFIDAGHTYEEVRDDIYTFTPLVKEGGLLAGHDYYGDGDNQNYWPGVAKAVNEVLGSNFWREPGTSFWITDKPLTRPSGVFDCMMFNNEYDILEKHLQTMWDAVDRFVIVEATVTHSGKPKPLNFQNNLGRFEKFLPKITYLVVEDSPAFNGSEDSAWVIERHQREAIMRALTDCNDDDIIIVGDCDEIPDPESLKNFQGEIAALSMDLFLFYNKVKGRDKWRHAKIMTYRKLKEIGPNQARYMTDVPDLVPGGQHLSWFGDVDAIIEKIHNTAHRNIDTPRYTDPEHIKNCIDNGLDLFDRDIKYEVCEA